VSWWLWLLIAAAVSLGIYAGFVLFLLLAGRREDARALAGFIPDCAVLTSRLLRDPRVPRRRSFCSSHCSATCRFPSTWFPTLSRSPANSTT